MTKKLLLLLLTTQILACATSSTDPAALNFSLPEGSKLSLNKQLNIPPQDTHAVIQNGVTINDRDRNDYAINCRLDFKEFGPRIIGAEKFTIIRTEDGSNWISQPAIMRYYTEIYLTSNEGTDVIKMVCQEYGDNSDRNFTVAEMQTALGTLITFEY